MPYRLKEKELQNQLDMQIVALHTEPVEFAGK
jgi:hypothetical protein